MSDSRVHRALLALAIGAILASPAASAAAARGSAPRPFPARHAALSPWDLLSWFLGSFSNFTKEGCGIDPHGGCATSQGAPVQLDTGCTIDPHGGCASIGH